MAHSGYFDTDNGKRYYYEAEKHISELTGKETDDPDVSNLREPGYMIFAIKDTDNMEKTKWETIANLPLLGWEDVEMTLAYDWGEAGSRPYTNE